MLSEFFQIHDSTLSGSSDDDDFLGALRGPSSFANAFLYVGLGTVALGLVILFVGTGEKGFKTVELRLIGPLLIGMHEVFFYKIRFNKKNYFWKKFLSKESDCCAVCFEYFSVYVHQVVYHRNIEN